MKHSEQLDTRLWLAADPRQCAGLLLQRMPEEKDATADAVTVAENTWEHCTSLAGTLRGEELLGQSSETIMHKLFWEDDLLAYPAQQVQWHCPCTRERVARMLYQLGRKEVDEIIEEQGHAHVDCHFCGKPYDFDAVDCAALFVDGPHHITAPGSDLLH